MLDAEHIEEIARKIHEQYRETWWSLEAQKPGEPPTDSELAAMEWAHLDEETKNENRRQARQIEDKLRKSGLVPCPASDPDGRPLELQLTRLVWCCDGDERPLDIEELARAEHRAWMRTKLEHGWVYGANRDDERRWHPLLKAWDELTPAQQELDMAPVRAIPGYLNAAGFHVKPDPHA